MKRVPSEQARAGPSLFTTPVALLPPLSFPLEVPSPVSPAGQLGRRRAACSERAALIHAHHIGHVPWRGFHVEAFSHFCCCSWVWAPARRARRLRGLSKER